MRILEGIFYFLLLLLIGYNIHVQRKMLTTLYEIQSKQHQLYKLEFNLEDLAEDPCTV